MFYENVELVGSNEPGLWLVTAQWPQKVVHLGCKHGERRWWRIRYGAARKKFHPQRRFVSEADSVTSNAIEIHASLRRQQTTGLAGFDSRKERGRILAAPDLIENTVRLIAGLGSE